MCDVARAGDDLQVREVGAGQIDDLERLLDVVNREGVPMGQVKELLQSAAQSVLVLQYPSGDVLLERMIPFVAAFVDAVDLQARRITVDWQDDY